MSAADIFGLVNTGVLVAMYLMLDRRLRAVEEAVKYTEGYHKAKEK